jgi:hypothetical protein
MAFPEKVIYFSEHHSMKHLQSGLLRVIKFNAIRVMVARLGPADCGVREGLYSLAENGLNKFIQYRHTKHMTTGLNIGIKKGL